ncbi:bifunctional hydroxymethylpyrimidine kinase/phosphomethylpyrimidine kinase [Tenacibaculum maritimum]|nr:bifunctional hydroxymethylpyrimidine kinase/phosphomethylpyrimidine kinase [Tenacibaculum maritimum]MDB0613985.1 bifunctional hydroxymethylpyrimidine kinase/phosphomethylpyrimidine kinase [Tenacibaculum maritimum]
MKRKQYILTIAGLDPSGGAGITSDIKTFEAHNAYGLSVCTAITVQHDLSFKSCTWMAKNLILSQIDILFERFTINVVKIGIIQSWEFLLEVVQKLKELKKEVKIILDPILKASTGFDFHHKAPKKY